MLYFVCCLTENPMYYSNDTTPLDFAVTARTHLRAEARILREITSKEHSMTPRYRAAAEALKSVEADIANINTSALKNTSRVSDTFSDIKFSGTTDVFPVLKGYSIRVESFTGETEMKLRTPAMPESIQEWLATDTIDMYDWLIDEAVAILKAESPIVADCSDEEFDADLRAKVAKAKEVAKCPLLRYGYIDYDA